MTTSAPPQSPAADNTTDADAQASAVRQLHAALRSAIGDVFVGQGELVDFVLHSLFVGGHVLIEGVPGLGKTLLVRTLGAALGLPVSRIQFTPDLMPADITGTTVLADTASGGHAIEFRPGPILANLVLADEINRATPKTQSALLEAMQERTVSVGGRTVDLPDPFIVLATQNPIEQEGTYPLPEAQLDRFLVKLIVDYPTEADYHTVLDRTTGDEMPATKAVASAADVLAARAIVRHVAVSRQVQTYAIRLTIGTQPNSPRAPQPIRTHVALGAGPRAAQALLLLAKVKAILSGRFAVSCDDVRAVARPVLQHRLLLNYRAQAERVSPATLVDDVLAATSELSAD